MSDTREQVAKQCDAIVHMATAIAKMHRMEAMILRDSTNLGAVEVRGAMTAKLMETLGDVLNGMDAVTEDDAWVAPIMEEAQRRWPSTPNTTQGK